MAKSKKGSFILRPFISREGFFHVIVTVILFLAVSAAIALGFYIYRQEQEKFASLSADVQALTGKVSKIEEITEPLGKKINLTVPSVQKIDNVFLVAKLSIERYLTGVKVKGVIINSGALIQNNAKFRIIIGEQSREFTVKKISAGSSRKFGVDVPDVPFDNAQIAEIKNLSSSVSYFVD